MNPLIQLKKTAPVFLVALVLLRPFADNAGRQSGARRHHHHVRPTGIHIHRAQCHHPGRSDHGSYVDASGVTHGFLRTLGGSFTTIDPPGSTSTTPLASPRAG